jgi:hypothetical protein
MDDKWFRELIKPLPASSDHAHPSRADLRAYLHGRLPDIWRTGAHSPDAWTLTEVSQHLLICEGCAQQLALMRRQELEQIALQGALRTHALVYAMALAVLLVLNAFLVVMVPTPVLRSCGVVVDKISSAGAGESIEVARALPSAPKVCTSCAGAAAPVADLVGRVGPSRVDAAVGAPSLVGVDGKDDPRVAPPSGDIARKLHIILFVIKLRALGLVYRTLRGRGSRHGVAGQAGRARGLSGRSREGELRGASA